MSNRDYASKQLKQIQNRIATALSKSARDGSPVTLIGASKRQSSQLIADFYKAGLKDVGENYLQEAIEKRADLTNLDLQWHFIGQIQSNKTKLIAENFSWVHGVDRLKIARRLAQHANPEQPLNLLLQLNIDDEDSKGGVALDKAATLCQQISELENIVLRGFMLIPQARDDFEQQRQPFAVARQTLESVNQQYGLKLDTLSMGMSQDLEAAIAEGATMVRVGTDLFGARKP